jgi:hypothetical protein
MVCVEGEPFVKKIDGLDKAILSFLYISFVANLEYPKVSYFANFLVQF